MTDHNWFLSDHCVLLSWSAMNKHRVICQTSCFLDEKMIYFQEKKPKYLIYCENNFHIVTNTSLHKKKLHMKITVEST